MSLPTQQLSQFSSKRHENFCLCFCAQVEKNRSKGDAPNASYVEQATRVFVQLGDEKRWKNLCTCLSLKSHSDGGELLSRFAKNWFVSLAELTVENKDLYIVRMLRFIMEVFQAEALSSEPLFTLHAAFSSEIEKIEALDLKTLCMYILEILLQGKSVPNRWIGMGSTILCRMADITTCCFPYKERNLSGRSFRSQFVLQCLDEVVTSDSVSALATLIKECGMQDVLAEYVTAGLKKDLNHQLCVKLILLVTEIPLELMEQVCGYLLRVVDFSLSDLLPLLVSFHSVLSSNAIVARTVFSIVKKEKHLTISRIFPLLCVLSLSNTPRMHSTALGEVKQNMVKLWKHSGKLKESEWIRDTVGKCDMEMMKTNLENVVEAVTRNQAWSPIIGDSLRDLAFMLLTEKQPADLKVSKGRVEEDSGLFSLGKRILIAIADSDPLTVGSFLDQIFLSISVCTNHSSALCLIDVVVDIVLKHTLQVLNSWKLLKHLVDTICSLKEDMGVALVRALLPVIVQRSELVSAIVSQMKKHVLCETTVTTALPILLLLLRSSTVRAAVRDDQFSQSFATFSTQTLNSMGVSTSGKAEVALEITSILTRTLSQPAATRIVLYRGIVENCYANENLVDPSLELLSGHLSSLPALSRDAYVEATKTSTVLLESYPHLVQAVSVLVRLSIHGSRNVSTQIINKRDLQINRAVEDLQRVTTVALESDLHDLELDKVADFSPSATGRANLLFATMLIGLYDALMEHQWHVGNVLVEVEAAEKILGLLRKREELDDLLKEKMAKRKEGKVAKAPGTEPVFLQLGTISSMLSTFIEKKSEADDEIEINETCVRLLRSETFNWLMDWAERAAANLQSFMPQPSLSSLSTFARLSLMLATVHEGIIGAADTYIWDGKCAQAASAFSSTVSYIVSKYGSRGDSAIKSLWTAVCKDDSHKDASGTMAVILLLRFLLATHLPKLFESYQDFTERKVGSDFSRQALSFLAASRALASLIPNNNAKLLNACFKCAVNLLKKFQIEEKPVLKEIWRFMTHTARRGMCEASYTNILKTAASQIIELMKKDEANTQLEAVYDKSVNLSAEMVIEACVSSFSDIRLVVDILSQPSSEQDLDGSLTKALDLGKRLSEIVKILVHLVHVENNIHKERLCALLTALYSALNATAKLMQTKQKTTGIIEWKSVTALAEVANGPVLKIMETADENVGTLNPDDEANTNMKQPRKKARSIKDETLYVSYVRAREVYQANLLLLSSALDDDRLDVQVKNNSIGVRDFRIDAEKLRQRVARIEDGEDGEETTPPPKKRTRAAVNP